MPKQSDWHILWRCFRYLRPYWRMTGGIYLAMLLINLANILTPQLIRWSIDRGIFGGDLTLLGLAAGGLLAVTLVKGVVIFFQGKWSEEASQNVAYDLRRELLEKLSTLSFSFHDRTEAGQILTRAMQDVERIRFLTGRAVLRLVEGTVLILFTAVALVWMNAALAALILLILPPLIHRAYTFGRRFRPLSFEIQDQLGRLTTQLEQNLRGARIVKAFAQEEAEINRFVAENEKLFDLSAESTRVQAANAPMLDMIANFGTVLIFWYGGWLVVQGSLTLGELVAFTTYLAMLVGPIRNIGRIIPILAIAASAGERLFAILDAPVDVADDPQARPLPRLQGHVHFDHASFAYQSGHTILRDVSFTVQPGQIVALMGATGSGKSTLVNLMARFYDPTAGTIRVDGHDTRCATLHSLRSQIGFVMQDTILFAATIRENIAFGRPEATEADVIQAAQDAQAHDFIMAMPAGYDTHVGERGVTLSGGQKQRLAIARALLTDPRILILDDATASVDNKTERLIQQALNRLMAGRTTFIIAHRLSTVQRADLVLLLEYGRLVAQGTHESLLASSPLYQQIYELHVQPQLHQQRGAEFPDER
ncbi:MAG: ABC transporter ATP-binding protein/permease [Chloroflexi bacterium]|nr:ABC transporter ATP-binding protein/permease [Chloroflexota bacterium]MCI0579904.1 ABC transporter ATP-binding protein/permease [Chloroflexota bacterium]MCI0646487.1 ABC transporter ATP-binding protein/permease [Chloroflexota bacterium]MCI0726161.1 ABC transporter ATP-binding protein/permease [Chloroflexota bacterium]